MQCEVEIEVRIDEGLQAVLADRVQIEQVLVNLLRNAMDAMDAGKPSGDRSSSWPAERAAAPSRSPSPIPGQGSPPR